MKGALAVMVLSRIDAWQDGPDRLVSYGRADLLSHSLVRSAHVEAGELPAETLCSAIVLYSGNGAANLLLARVRGPAALTAYVRGLGDMVTRFDRTELALNDRSGMLDTTTPWAMASASTAVPPAPEMAMPCSAFKRAISTENR